jgi:hypothetical protein
MTEKDDTTRSSDSLSAGTSDPKRTGQTDGSAEAGLSREGWERLPADPGLEADLGYRLAEWEEYSTLDGTEELMFLPADEGLLREDAFVVAGEESVKDLGQWY